MGDPHLSGRGPEQRDKRTKGGGRGRGRRQDKDLPAASGESHNLGCTQPPDTHQPCTVVTGEVLVTDLHQAPKSLLRRARTRKEGGA